ncbi:unnamed protein product [Cuscuta europaea]|uniref:Uncharacterized protein n=1 Tax=Cuscuta europaea TaxID=41803 RepID=A0A9P0Z7M4_CUSEU|nr:unnamed protein product [Cuscuta europaea]
MASSSSTTPSTFDFSSIGLVTAQSVAPQSVVPDVSRSVSDATMPEVDAGVKSGQGVAPQSVVPVASRGMPDATMPEVDVGVKSGVPPRHGEQAGKKKKEVAGMRGRLAALAAKEDARFRPSRTEVIPFIVEKQHGAPPVNQPAPTLSASSILDMARSIKSYSAGLMDTAVALQTIGRRRDELQHQADEAHRHSVAVQRRADEATAALSELQSKYDFLQSKYDRLQASFTDAGRQEVAAFQTSPKFSKIITSKLEAHRSEQVQAWLKTEEGQLWRDKEILMSFRCGRYDMQTTLYNRLAEFYPDFDPEKIGLPEIMPDPDGANEQANDLSLLHLDIPDDLEDAVHGFDFETILNGVPENMPDP